MIVTPAIPTTLAILTTLATLAILPVAQSTQNLAVEVSVWTGSLDAVIWQSDTYKKFVLTCVSNKPYTEFIFYVHDPTFTHHDEHMYGAIRINNGQDILIPNSKYRVTLFGEEGREAHFSLNEPNFEDATKYYCIGIKDKQQDMKFKYLNFIGSIAGTYSRSTPYLNFVADLKWRGDLYVYEVEFDPMYNNDVRRDKYKGNCKKNKNPHYKNAICKASIKDGIWEWKGGWGQGWIQYHITSITVKMFYHNFNTNTKEYYEEYIQID